MPKNKRESPSFEQPVRDKSSFKEPITISPEALGLLRSAAIPPEFLKIAREFTPRTEGLPPTVPQDSPMSAEIEEPYIERPMPERLVEPELEMPTEPWTEELPEPEFEVSVEPDWEVAPWPEPEAPPEPPEEVRRAEGAATFYLTDLKLDLSGVAHMTPGLSVMATSSLYPIVINNLACCMTPQDGEGPGEEERGRGEGEEVVDCVECRLICIIGSARNETLGAALQAAVRYYDSGAVKDCLQIVKLESKVNATASLYLGGGKWSKPFNANKLKTEMVKPAGKGKPQIECFTHVLAFYHGESKAPPGTSAPVESFVTKDVLTWLVKRLGAPVRNLYLWSCYGSEKIDVTGMMKKPLDDFKSAMEKLKAEVAKKRPNKCKCDLCVFTAPSVKINTSRQALVDQRQQLEDLLREAQRTGSEAAAEGLQDSLKKLGELSKAATDETLEKLEKRLGSDEFPVPLGIKGNHLVTGQPEGYDPVLTVRGLNKALKETGLR